MCCFQQIKQSKDKQKSNKGFGFLLFRRSTKQLLNSWRSIGIEAHTMGKIPLA